MKHGDISNELPKRILVATDVFLETEVSVKKRLKVIPVVERTNYLRRDILSRLYLFTTRAGVTLELVTFTAGHDEYLADLMNQLDEMGTNPFRYFSVYRSIDALIKELPYRPEVIGVLDKPSNLLRYGHWGMDFSQI